MKIFLRIIFGSIYTHHVETKIKEKFIPEYDIEFVDSPSKADLIIASRWHDKDEDTRTVYISEQFTKKDFLRIHDALKYIKKLIILETRTQVDDYMPE